MVKMTEKGKLNTKFCKNPKSPYSVHIKLCKNIFLDLKLCRVSRIKRMTTKNQVSKKKGTTVLRQD